MRYIKLAILLLLLNSLLYSQSLLSSEWESWQSENSDLPHNSLYVVTVEGEELIWIGTFNGGVASFDGVEWNVYNTENSDLPANYVRAIVVSGDGIKWIGTSGSLAGGIAKFDGETWTIYNTDNSDLPHNDVRAVAIEGDSVVWMGTDGGGVAAFNGEDWTVYNVGNSGIPSNLIRSITPDDDGVKWIGTNSGLAKFDGEDWTVYDFWNSDIPSPLVNSVTIDEHDVKWIGTSAGGLAEFDGEDWTVYNPSNSDLPSDIVNGVVIDDYDIKWIATGSGIAQFDGEEWMIYNPNNSGLPGFIVRDIAIDVNSKKWMGTNNGLAAFLTYPEKVLLAYPPVGTEINIYEIEEGIQFGWYPSMPGVTNYKIEIAFDIEFTDTLFYDEGVIDTFYLYVAEDWEEFIGQPLYWRVSAENVTGWGEVSDVWSFTVTPVGIEDPKKIPDLYTLHNNFPNPFNPSTTIRYGLPERSIVKLEIYNTLGQRVATLVNGELEAGYHEVVWHSGRAASGLYFYRMEASPAINSSNRFVTVRSMVLVK